MSQRSGRVTGLLALSLFGIGMSLIAGCGATAPVSSSVSASGSDTTNSTVDKGIPSCPLAPETLEEAGTVIVLDWTDGASPLNAAKEYLGLDPTTLNLSTGTLTEEEAAEFREEVRLTVESILCRLDPVDMRIIEGEADDYPWATRVWITDEFAPAEGQQIGQADYDPCNAHEDDRVLLWGERMREVCNGKAYPRSAWVNLLANTIAHEIGHTLGFHHPDELDYVIPASIGQSEIMLSSHTLSSLMREQGFYIEQSSCPLSGGQDSGLGYKIVPEEEVSNDSLEATGFRFMAAEDDVIVYH